MYPARDKLVPYDTEINNLKELAEVLIHMFCPTRSYYDLQNELSQASCTLKILSCTLTTTNN